ncbi:hypothetical protein VTN02DRAFT_674 [Thermoascus thermophilus]
MIDAAGTKPTARPTPTATALTTPTPSKSEASSPASPLPEKTLPAFLTTLFDDSYLPDPLDRSSPYASPVLAPDDLLRTALPRDVFLYTCEWDMLLKEGQHFVRRLQRLGKRVRAMMIEKVPHAWDKSANPFRDQGRVNVLYRDACAEMRALLVDEVDAAGAEAEAEAEAAAASTAASTAKTPEQGTSEDKRVEGPGEDDR